MCWMVMLPGPVKVDLIVADVPHEHEPPWEPSPSVHEEARSWTPCLFGSCHRSLVCMGRRTAGPYFNGFEPNTDGSFEPIGWPVRGSRLNQSRAGA